jgi:ABC-type glycerol-3-phosphate transport system substrate-binding protein
MRYTLLLIVAMALTLALAACASPNPGGYDTADLMAEYCATAGPNRTTSNTQTTVHHWDHEATTAGHRGTVTNDTMEPDLNQAKPHGC